MIFTCKAKVTDCCLIDGKLFFEIESVTKKEGKRYKWINYDASLDYHKEVKIERNRGK